MEPERLPRGVIVDAAGLGGRRWREVEGAKKTKEKGDKDSKTIDEGKKKGGGEEEEEGDEDGNESNDASEKDASDSDDEDATMLFSVTLG